MRFTELLAAHNFKDGGSMEMMFESDQGTLIFLRMNLQMSLGGLSYPAGLKRGSLLLSRKNDFFSSPEAKKQKKIYTFRQKANRLARELEEKLHPTGLEEEISELLADLKPCKSRSRKYDYLDSEFMEIWREDLSEKDLVLRDSALEKEVMRALEQFLLEQRAVIDKEEADTVGRLLKIIYARSADRKPNL